MKYETKVDDQGQLRIYYYGSWKKAVKHECVYCGNEFIRPESSGGYAGRFCSNLCNNRANAKLRRRTARITKRCPICRRFFDTIRSHDKHRVTCGRRECFSEIRRINANKRYEQSGQRAFTRGK